MRITQLHVTNYRCLRDATLDCRPATALVGRNGAGKSTFLHALGLFYDRTAAVSAEDYYDHNISSDIAIEIRFEQLRPEELAELAPYIENNTLTITKRFAALASDGATSTGKYFATTRAFAPFSSVVGTAKERTTILAQLIDDGMIPGNPAKPRTGKDVDEFIRVFESEHPDLLTPQEREEQFFGDKNVGTGKLDKFTRFVYVPAVRDVSDETADRKSSFAQLIDIFILQKLAAKPDIVNLASRLQSVVDEAYNLSAVQTDVTTLENDLNDALRPFVSNAELSLRMTNPQPSVSQLTVVPFVTEDDYSSELRRKGHGLQRAVLLTVLSQYARVRGSSAADVEAGAEFTPDVILAIEEPELYQHPARCRQLASVLREITGAQGPGRPQTQVLFSTHSPFFTDIEKFEDIVIVRKMFPTNGSAAHTETCSRRVGDLVSPWARCCGKPSDQISPDAIMARMRRPFLTAAGEGFFADTVVLVEGTGDASLLGRLAERMGKEWHAKGIAVLPVDGKSNMGAPVIVFTELRIPVYAVFDADDAKRGKKNEVQCGNENLFLQRSFNVSSPTEFPDQQVTDRFACFGDELESYCRSELGDGYSSLVDGIADDLGLKPSDALKNVTGAALFVDRVYGEGGKLPFLEQIVDAITTLGEVTLATYRPAVASAA